MRIRVLGGNGGGFLSDVKVWLVGAKDSAAADFLRRVFPSSSVVREDGSVGYGISPGTGQTPKVVDAVEIESPTLTAIILGVLLLVAGLTIALILKK